MKKAILVVFCALTAAVLFAGPSQQQASKMIAYVLPHKSNAFQNSLAAALQKEIQAAGYSYTEYVANNDAPTAITQIEQAIQRKAAGIIVDGFDAEALAPSAAAAKKAGIPLVTVHEGINSPDVAAAVGPDFTVGGKQKMAQAMADLPNGGSIAFMYGPQGHPAQIAISSGYPQALAGQEAKYPVVFTAYGDWSDVSALNTVSSWLSSGKKIDAIVCDNDGEAMGAIQAIKSAGKTGQIKVYGLDGDTQGLQAVKDGSMAATIKVDIDAEAKYSVESLIKVINKQPVEKSINLPMLVITSKNVSQFM
jgi:ribose transport system substrate-binding protein/inositol transport system substrate-binding protein